MKNMVHFSTYCIIVTVGVLGALLAGIIMTWNHPHESQLGIVVFLVITGFGLYYCPVSVTVDSEGVKLHRLLSGDKVFRYADIEEVDTCYPSVGGLRLCGSGGMFGYWGYFSDIMIGQYFGYYADRSECFYIRLKNRRQYVLSCRNHVATVKEIQKHLHI